MTEPDDSIEQKWESRDGTPLVGALHLSGLQGRKVGRWFVEVDELPISQMKIFDFENYSTAMVGLVFQRRADEQQPILLFHDPHTVNYFRYVFESYREHGWCTQLSEGP